jgi:ketosteroid isomerase-like protein
MSVRDVIEHGDFGAFASALAPDVVWVGLEPGWLCRSRDEVLRDFRRAIDRGHGGQPEIVAEADDRLVVDPHVEPPLPEAPELHHVFVVSGEHIVEMRDYRDRRSALEAVGL